MSHKSSASAVIAKGALALFGVVVVLVNAAVTWQFGAHYLVDAFGIADPALASIAGGGYAILFLDVASLVWLFAYMRLAETSAQRGIAIAAAIIAFVGSLLATTYMLASGTAGVLATHAAAVSSAAQIAMIVIVVVHAVLLVIYMLRGRGEMVTQTTIDAATSATGEALTLAAANVQNMVPRLAQDIGAAIERRILSELSFTRDDAGQLVYTPNEQPARQLPPPSDNPDNGWRPYPAQQSGTDQQNINPPTGSPARDVYDVQERFHTIFSDIHGDTPVSTALNRDEFNALVQAAERAKRDGRLSDLVGGANPTNGQNGRH